MNHKQLARDLFLAGYNCAQSVFVAFRDITGLDEKTALMLSSSFGGGMGRLREVCGACSGMFMVAGMLYGYSELDDEKKAEHYALIQSLAKEFRFEHENGSIICKELLARQRLEADSSPTPCARTDEYYKARPCLKYVEDAAEILDRLIASKNAK